jgi:hypothetical protein
MSAACVALAGYSQSISTLSRPRFSIRERTDVVKLERPEALDAGDTKYGE